MNAQRKYERTEMGNETMDGDGYRISYASATTGFFAGNSFLGCDTDEGETALVVGDKFFILNGDFREAYAALDSLGDCLRFFVSKPELLSSWSAPIDEATARIGASV